MASAVHNILVLYVQVQNSILNMTNAILKIKKKKHLWRLM